MTPEANKYRVWWVINPPTKVPTYTYVKSVEEARQVITKEVELQLRDPNIWGNAFGLEVLEDGEWSEWYDDDGFDIMETL
jgi:hypothetical protein